MRIRHFAIGAAVISMAIAGNASTALGDDHSVTLAEIRRLPLAAQDEISAPLERLANAIHHVGLTIDSDVYTRVDLEVENGTVILMLTDPTAAARVLDHAQQRDPGIEVERVRVTETKFSRSELVRAIKKVSRGKAGLSSKVNVPEVPKRWFGSW